MDPPSPKDKKKYCKLFLVWGAILLMYSASAPFIGSPYEPGDKVDFQDNGWSVRAVATSSIRGKFIAVVGGGLSFGLCIFWSQLCQHRDQRRWLPRLGGIVIFLFSTFVLVARFNQFAINEGLAIHSNGKLELSIELVNILIGIVMVSVLLGIAYVLEFKKSFKLPIRQ